MNSLKDYKEITKFAVFAAFVKIPIGGHPLQLGTAARIGLSVQPFHLLRGRLSLFNELIYSYEQKH